MTPRQTDIKGVVYGFFLCMIVFMGCNIMCLCVCLFVFKKPYFS